MKDFFKGSNFSQKDHHFHVQTENGEVNATKTFFSYKALQWLSAEMEAAATSFFLYGFVWLVHQRPTPDQCDPVFDIEKQIVNEEILAIPKGQQISTGAYQFRVEEVKELISLRDFQQGILIFSYLFDQFAGISNEFLRAYARLPVPLLVNPEANDEDSEEETRKLLKDPIGGELWSLWSQLKEDTLQRMNGALIEQPISSINELREFLNRFLLEEQ